MTLLFFERSGAMGVAIALIGCQLVNPAFDPADGGTEDDGDTTQSSNGDGDGDPGDGDPGDGDPGDGDPGDGDPGDGDPGDGDPGDGDGEAGDGDGDTGMEAPIEQDFGMSACVVDTHPGLWPHVGEPQDFLGQQCPPEIGVHVRVVGSVNGDWVASPCPNGCNVECELNKQWQIGAAGIDDGLANLYPPVAFNQQQPWIGCYYVEAAELLKQEFSGCYYASLSAHTHEGPNSPLLFNANRDTWGLTPGAVGHYGDWQPAVEDQNLACDCDELGIECCPGEMVVAKQFVLGDPVLPGSTAEAYLGNTPFNFYAAQAQSGVECGMDLETSWALWAK